MKVEIKIDEKCVEPKIIIYAKEINKEISDIADFLSSKNEKENIIFNAFKDDNLYIIKENDIESIYAENGKLYIQTENDKFIIKKRLYELEEILPKNKFVRISNSEIANFDKVNNLNLKLYGTICINFKSGHSSYVSRRYIKKIKEFLNV